VRCFRKTCGSAPPTMGWVSMMFGGWVPTCSQNPALCCRTKELDLDAMDGPALVEAVQPHFSSYACAADETVLEDGPGERSVYSLPSVVTACGSRSMVSSGGFLEKGGQLEVPQCFADRGLRSGCGAMQVPGNSCGPGGAPPGLSSLDPSGGGIHWEDQQILFQQVLRSFVRSLQVGVEVQVLLDNGNAVPVEASLTEDLSRLVLRVRDVERDVGLDDIEKICGPEEARENGTTNAHFLDECCATLVLGSEQFLTFTFENKRLREYFEACLKALIAARSAAVKHNQAI